MDKKLFVKNWKLSDSCPKLLNRQIFGSIFDMKLFSVNVCPVNGLSGVQISYE